MTGQWLNISLIEDFFYTLLKSEKLAKVVVGTKIHDNIDKGIKRMTLIELSRIRE